MSREPLLHVAIVLGPDRGTLILSGSAYWAADARTRLLLLRRAQAYLAEEVTAMEKIAGPPSDAAAPEVPKQRRGEFECPESVETSKCRSCDEEIAWIKTARGANMPLSVRSAEKRDGKVWMLSHFADCPKAATHRRA